MFAAAHLPGQSFTSAPHVAHLDYPGSSAMASSYGSGSTDPTSHTQQPIMTGTSVLGIKYDGGVMLAADTLASYGSLSRFDDIQRLHPVGRYTCIGASGDMSDFQALQHMLDASSIKQSQLEDGHELRSSQVFEYLGRVMYNRRTKMDPLWNSLVVAGWETDRLAPGKSSGEDGGDADADAERPGKPFLAYVDLQGTTYSEPSMATGYGSMIAQPLMRKALQQAPNGVLTEQAAEELLKTCMKVLFYRDARSINKFQIAKITKKGVEISDSQSVDTYWGFAEKLRGYA